MPTDSSENSAEVFFQVAQAEYQLETERFRSIDERSGIMLAALMALLALFLPSAGMRLEGAEQIVLYGLICVAALVSVVFLCLALSVRAYSHVSSKDITNLDYHILPRDASLSTLAVTLAKCTLANIEVNNRKLRQCQFAVGAFATMCFCMIAFSVIQAIGG